MATAYFTPKSFAFLRDLKANNNREWFAEHKPRYEEHIKTPALRLIEDFAPHLKKISPHFMATPRSLFRIYRDTRFSKDKTPYKTATGIHFRHDRAKDAYAPGFYFHIEPKQVFVAMGIWHPQSPAVRMIREHIVEDPTGWKRASRGKRFTEAFELEGESLKRPPRGIDPEHPLIDDLKRKDFIGVQRVTQSFATDADLPKELAARFKVGAPLVRYLCGALDVPF
ncbi:MAG: DUF2461 domain-containing protein [Gemmatimonadota bacterium]